MAAACRDVNCLHAFRGLAELDDAVEVRAGLVRRALAHRLRTLRPGIPASLGGGGDAQGVVDALSVITQDPQVKSIFFNIFGGITRCDEVARGILQALGQISIDEPIVVRFDGTNAEEGRQLLVEGAPEKIHVESTMLDAARRAVELAAMLTEARALRAGGDQETAEIRYGEAATIAREGSVPSRLREVLREWAGLRAEAGDHRGAYELTNEALAVN